MQTERLANLLDMLEKEPDDAFLLYAVGLEYTSLQNPSESWKWFAKLLEKHPEYLPAYYQGALLKIASAENELAIQLLQKGIALAQSKKDMKTFHELEELLEQMEE